MSKPASISAALVIGAFPSTRDAENPGEQLNRRVLQTLRDLACEIEEDPDVVEEYVNEIFNDFKPRTKKKKNSEKPR